MESLYPSALIKILRIMPISIKSQQIMHKILSIKITNDLLLIF